MKLDSFLGIKKVEELVPTKFNATIQWIVQWWNDHDSGVRSFTNISFGVNSNSISSNTTLGSNDVVVFVDATVAVTVTLPTAIGIKGKWYSIIVTTGTKIVTLATSLSQTINRASNVFLPGQDMSVTVISDGSNWFIST